MAYVRTVTTASGATAVQIVWSSHRGSRQIEHIGSAHDQAGVDLLKASARQRINQSQDQLPFEDQAVSEPLAVAITSMRMGRLLDTISHVYRQLGLDQAAGNDVVFEQLVTARIIEPSSKQDASRVLEEAGIQPASYPTVKRRLPVYAEPKFRNSLSKALSAKADLGPAALVPQVTAIPVAVLEGPNRAGRRS